MPSKVLSVSWIVTPAFLALLSTLWASVITWGQKKHKPIWKGCSHTGQVKGLCRGKPWELTVCTASISTSNSCSFLASSPSTFLISLLRVASPFSTAKAPSAVMLASKFRLPISWEKKRSQGWKERGVRHRNTPKTTAGKIQLQPGSDGVSEMNNERVRLGDTRFPKLCLKQTNLGVCLQRLGRSAVRHCFPLRSSSANVKWNRN